ncbi:MAG: HAMP domain-containing histidine kinase [Bacillota bacterium]|nr:HAMP domain-containing histidine kinase [Bacillota bacterium]
MERSVNNYNENLNFIAASGISGHSLYKDFEDDANDIVYCIAELIRYHIFIKNKTYIYSKEYENRINKIISMFKKIIDKIEFKYDTYSKCISDFQNLKKFFYSNIEIYNADNAEVKMYYLSVDKIIDDITIRLLKIIGEKQWQMFNNEGNKYFSISNISHDLKTPINIILCSNQLTCMKNNDKSLLKYNGIIKNNCYKLLRMVDNIIDSVKGDNGELSLNSYNIDIVPLISDLSKTVSDYIKSKGINFQYICKLKEKVMSIDCEKIERIILNLLSNAIKYTDPGGLITLKLEKEKEYIKVSVKDNGHGIPKNKQKNIFNRFFQLNKDDGYRGTGIGLSLVKSFTELMKGKIELNSDIGKGTEFVIYLPDIVDSSNEYLSYDNYYNNHVLIMNKEFSEL